MDPRITRLADACDEAAALLHAVGDAHWAKWLAGDAARIRKRDFRGVEHTRTAFGGMGSLNDIGLPPDDDGARISRLLDEIRTLTRDLRPDDMRA